MREGTRPGPELRAFHLTILRGTLWLAVGVTGLIVLAGLTGQTVIPPVHTLANAIFTAICCGLLVVLNRRPAASALVSGLFLAALFGLVTLATLLIPEDPLRVTWYFAVVGAAFLLAGPLAGVAIAGAAILVVAGLAVWGAELTPTAAMTFAAALGATTAAFASFSVQARSLLGAMTDAANRDPLTGLENRRAFEAALERLCAASRPFALLIVDVDHFKCLNDTHGHAVGDVVLVGIARVLALAVRGEDLVARIGGEEFAVLLPGAGPEVAQAVAERLRTAVAGARFHASEAEPPVGVTISVGAAVSAAPHIGKAVFLAADAALYQAKAAGRNRMVLAEP